MVVLCRYFFSEQGCRRGSSCRFLHDEARFAQRHTVPGIVPACAFYSREGVCRHGDGCRFSHAINNVAEAKNPLHDDRKTVVQDLAGGAKMEIKDGMELSIWSLPPSSHSTLTTTADMPRRSAIISFVRDRVSILLNWPPSIATASIEECRNILKQKINLRFFHFNKPVIKLRVIDEKSSVEPKFSIDGNTYLSSSGSRKGRKILVLKNVKPNVTIKDIRDACGAAATWYYAQLIESPYSQATLVKAILEKMALRAQPAEYNVIPNGNSSLIRINARYQVAEDVDVVIKHFDGQIMCNSSGRKVVKLSVKRNFVAKIDVRTGILEVLPKMIPDLVKRNSDIKIQQKKPDLVRARTAIYISSEKAEKVAEIRNRLMILLGGVIAKDGDTYIWGPAFTVSWISKELDRIMKLTKTFLLRDIRQRCIRMYGEPLRINEAVSQLKKLRQSNKILQKHQIKVSEDDHARIFGQDFRIVACQFGPNCLQSKISDGIYYITFLGTSEQYSQFLPLLNGKVGQPDDCPICFNIPQSPVRLPCSHAYCAECFTKQCTSASQGSGADIPLVCYSADCSAPIPLDIIRNNIDTVIFNGLCKAALSGVVRSNPEKYRHCPSPECGAIFRPLLPGDVNVEPEILEPSHPNYKFSINSWPFLSLIDHSPQNYTIPIFNCTSCFLAVCTRCCLPAHRPDMDCAQAMDLSQGGDSEFNEWRKTHDVRDCPRCRAPIQKRGGCNHMTCQNCKIHMCWFCMKTFKTDSEVYDHMDQRHDDVDENEADLEDDEDDEGEGEARRVPLWQWAVPPRLERLRGDLELATLTQEDAVQRLVDLARVHAEVAPQTDHVDAQPQVVPDPELPVLPEVGEDIDLQDHILDLPEVESTTLDMLFAMAHEENSVTESGDVGVASDISTSYYEADFDDGELSPIEFDTDSDFDRLEDETDEDAVLIDLLVPDPARFPSANGTRAWEDEEIVLSEGTIETVDAENGINARFSAATGMSLEF